MPNPTVINVAPAPNATDVILGSSITVTFSTAIDTDSFNNATFVLTGPNLSSIVTPDQLVEADPTPAQGSGYILGLFGFSTKTYQLWQPFTNYSAGAQILDSNSNVQTVVNTGRSAPYQPAWLTTLGQSTTDNNVPVWQPNTLYVFGQYILDPNGNLQKVTIGGLSGAVVPTWSTTLNATTVDNTATWTNIGALNPIVWMTGGVANSGGTVATFTPSQPLLPGTVYTVLIVGANAPLVSTFVQDPVGNKLLSSYQWSFTTGTLNVAVPPVQNPVPLPQTYIRPEQIQLIPRPPVGVDDPSVMDFTTIELIFPAPIDPNSFDPAQLLIGIEPIMNDPDVRVPPGATASYIIQGNKLIVTVAGLNG